MILGTSISANDKEIGLQSGQDTLDSVFFHISLLNSISRSFEHKVAVKKKTVEVIIYDLINRP